MTTGRINQVTIIFEKEKYKRALLDAIYKTASSSTRS